MSDYKVNDDIVTCDRCNEVFTDESTWISHNESDHGDKEESFEEVVETFADSMNFGMSIENLIKAKKALYETNHDHNWIDYTKTKKMCSVCGRTERKKVLDNETDQTELHYSKPFKNPKANIPTKLEPHNSADDTVAGVSGYNDNPNSYFYDNKKFRHGSSTERTGSLGESALSLYGVSNESFDEKWDTMTPTERETILTMKLAGYHGEDKRALAYNSFNELPKDIKNQLIDYYDVDMASMGLEPADTVLYNTTPINAYNESKTLQEADNYPQKTGDKDFDINEIKNEFEFKGEADNYPQKQTMTHNEWERDLSDLKSRYETESESVKYDPDGSVEFQGKETILDIPALEGVDFGFESYDEYPTKANESIEKSYVTETYSGIVDEYNRFTASESDDVNELVTSRKMQGYGSESIAKELVMEYGVSKEDALERVYSIEVSVNDQIANTFFQKRYSECSPSEKKELSLYAGSDE